MAKASQKPPSGGPTPSGIEAMSGSARQRRYRERHNAGINVEVFDVDHGLLREKLVGFGRMTEEEFADDRLLPAFGGCSELIWKNLSPKLAAILTRLWFESGPEKAFLGLASAASR